MYTSRAVIFASTNTIELGEVELAPLGPTDVLVQTSRTSINAGAERLLLNGQLSGTAGLSLPCIPGFESTGRIIEVGSDVSHTLLGQRVFVGGSRGYKNITSAWGGQSSLIVTDHRRVIPLRDLDDDAGLLIATTAIAWHGIQVCHMQPGQRILVLGAGLSGHVAAACAHMAGAASVTLCLPANTPTIAPHPGLQIITPSANDQALPADIDVLILTGGNDTNNLGHYLPLMRDNGRILLLGFYQRLDIDFAWLFMRELKILTSREWSIPDLLKARNLLAYRGLGPILRSLLSDFFPIERVAAAYATAFGDPIGRKVVLAW